MNHPTPDLRIDETELNLVDRFRQSRNTSVLTIMFTDIQGFTRLAEERGDAFFNEVRRSHDAGVRHDHKAALSLTLTPAQGSPVPAAKGVKAHHSLFWTLEWTVDLDGQRVSWDKLIVEHDPAAAHPTEAKKDLWGDVRHRYVLSYRLSDTFAQGDIQAQYAEYK
jgi:hypothetical protein